MSGGKDGSGARNTILGRLLESFRRPAPPERQVHRPVEEDLGLKTLRNVYSQYIHTEDPVEKERRLYTMLPLFLKNCSRLKGAELVTKFPECLEFSEHVALLFVRHVTQVAQTHGSRAGEALLKFLEVESDDGRGETGMLILKVLQVFAHGPEQLIDAMMSSDLSSILVRCIHLFLDLPPPSPSLHQHKLAGTHSPSSHSPVQDMMDDVEPDPTTRRGHRVVLQKRIASTLTHLCRHSSAVECLLRLGDLSLLFGAISSPCAAYNKIWRKAAADTLLAIFRHSLSSDVITFVHNKGCIGFCIRNIQLSVDQPPLDLVEIFATIFCCLKDSSDLSQVLMEDFAACGGHKFLFDYLLYLERKGSDDAREAVRNMVFLISGLVTAGFVCLEPPTVDPGPFQDPGFEVPLPLGPGSSVRNIDIFLVLQDAFLQSQSSHLGKTLVDTILSIYRSDIANYFILEQQRTLSAFLEILPQKVYDVQKHTFQLLEHVMVDLNYVPIPELTGLGLLLQQREHPKTISLGLNFLLRLISHTAKYKDVFREVGILQIMIGALKSYVQDLKDSEMEIEGRPDPHGELSSPSLPLQDVHGENEEYTFLLIECLRATIEGNIQNGQVFRECGGSRLTLELVTYRKPRRLALRLITQLILLPDGSVDFNALLDQLNCSSQTAVVVKSEILQTVLGVFQLDSHKKAVFREVCGFHYLISTLASLIGSLAPRRSTPWIGVPRSEVLKLVQLVFVVLMSAMQDDPANRMFFETNIRFDSFTAPLLLLGCFARDSKSIQPSREEDMILSSPSFQSFEAEFKTWQQPGERLDEDSFIFSAAEVFRFLRDMALDIPMAHSKSLLQVKSRRNTFESPAAHGGAGHLVHPGAVLCMVDLLPSVDVIRGQEEEGEEEEEEEEEGEEEEEEEGEELNGCRDSKESTTMPQEAGIDSSGVAVVVSGETTGETTGDHEGAKDSHLLDGGRGGRGGSVEETGSAVSELLEPPSLYSSREPSVETELRNALAGGKRRRLERHYCKMSPSEAKMWCLFLQERVVTEVYSLAMTERNQQALCQVSLPQRILTRCSHVLADDTHPLHQSMERTFERLSYQSLTPSDFRSFLRLGNPLCCTINDITIEQLEEESKRPKQTVPSIKQNGPSTKGQTGSEVVSNSHLPSNGIPDKQAEQESSQTPTPHPQVEGSADQALSTGKEAVIANGAESEKLAREEQETEKELQPLTVASNQVAKYGGSLSLARIQSLVSMTTPRSTFLSSVVGGTPFIEINHSIDGFGCLFLPSVFPQTIGSVPQMQGAPQPSSSLSINTSGVGYGGERVFPPSSGLTFSCWFFVSRVTPNDETLFTMLSLSQNFLSLDKKITCVPVFRILANLALQSLTITTQSGRERDKRDLLDDSRPDKIDTVTFPCPQLGQLQTWHHLVVTVTKTLRQKSKVSLFMDNTLLGAQKSLSQKCKVHLYVDNKFMGCKKMAYIRPVGIPDSLNYLPFPTESTPYLINAHIGTHVSQRHVCQFLIRFGPIFLFEDPISAQTVAHIYKLGPFYFGSFQAPVLGDTSLSSLLSPGVPADPLSSLVPEEKVVFGVSASHPTTKTVCELSKTYCSVDVATVARELSLSEEDDATPVTLLHNTSFHLYGPSRSLGAIMCGYSGIRAFEPQPLRNLLSSVGGTSVMLGLVAMATSVDSLYASMKALVCIVGNNQVALKEMERTGGFQVLGMLLRSKSLLINSNILHLTFTLVGTVDSEHESACIPNPIAFRDLLADLSVWSGTSEDIQRSLFAHFFDLLTHSSDRHANTSHMQEMKLISLLLYRLHDDQLSRATIKSICNVINALLGSNATKEDLRRTGQLLVTTLSERDGSSENDIDIYSNAIPPPPPSEHAQYDDSYSNEVNKRRNIVLRNMMLDMILSLLCSDRMELNTKFAVLLSQAVGLDWVLLFLQPNIHSDTITRALRILIQLLSVEKLQQKFHEGDIFGNWVKGFEILPTEMRNMLETAVTQVNPLRPNAQFPLPGIAVLSHLLPNHLHSPQVYLLMVAFLLGKTGLDIPFSAPFNMETLDNMFQIGNTAGMANVRLCPDAAFVLLAMGRVLLHQAANIPKASNLGQEPVELLIKFLERVYRTLPQFMSVAHSQEFIEALASMMFPLQAARQKEGASEMIEIDDEDEFVVVVRDTTDVTTQQPPADSGAAILRENDVAVCSIIQLLRTIAIDGFVSTQVAARDQKPVCQVLELVLAASPSNVSPELQKLYQTLVLNSIIEHLQVGNEDVTVFFRSLASAAFSRAMAGLGVFCGRLVDKLWQGTYLQPSTKVYNFLISLVEQALKQPNTFPLGDLYRSLNRIILYQLSTIPSTEEDQKALMETMCRYSGQAHIIFDETNVDSEFLECITYRLLQVMFTDTRERRMDEQEREKWSTSYQPMAQSIMKSGANRLWQKMLEKKHDSLQTILSVELPVPTSAAGAVVSVINTAATSSLPDLSLPTPTPTLPPSSSSSAVPSANSQYLRLQNCQNLLSHNLTKAWDVYLVSEKNTQGVESISRASRGDRRSLLRPSVLAKRRERERIKQSNIEGIVREYAEVLCPLLIVAAKKHEDLVVLKQQRNMDYRLRFTIMEWSRIEWELTRERGLWGPEQPSPLDKWMLDTVEGPHRMRKRMCRNHLFYHDYPYDPDAPSKGQTKHQKPTSVHSKLHFTLNTMFQRPTVLSGHVQGTHTTKPVPYVLPGHDNLMSMSIEYPSGPSNRSPSESICEETPPSPLLSKSDVLPKPAEDDPVSQAVAKMIEPDDEVTAKFQSARLTGLDSRNGVLLLGQTHFYMIEGVTLLNGLELIDIESVPDGLFDPVLPTHLHTPSVRAESIPIGCVKWPYTIVREVHKRRYLLRHCALEVFSSDGRNQFLIFHIHQRERLYQKLKSRCPNLAESGDDLVAGTHPDRDPAQAPGLISALLTGEKSPAARWANGEMSNFQYLMQLNTLAGRSYNDLMQYPIFPWVLADYASETLDLTNPATFRNFSLPMGAQSEERLKRFIERYILTSEDPTGEGIPPYYYGTHYSSAMIVASYLIRMEPFTGHFLKLQGGHFDLPDRLFHSIPVAWHSASYSNMADIKELIPEFFYLPEFLENTNHFNLGTKQSGEELGDVVLPPWAKGSPHEFIRLHREALESDYVSTHLHEWIDLIFGYKQTGKEAQKAHNVFHHLFYEGAVDIDKIDDPVKKGAVISFIHNFGQMPKQLFKKPHPARKSFSFSPNPSLPTPPVTMDTWKVFYKNLSQLMPSKEPVKEIRGEVHYISFVADKYLLALDRNKIALPPLYNRYFMWGFPDRSARVALVEGDKVLSVFENLHQGRILCATMGDDNMLLTGGDSTIVCVWQLKNAGSKDRSPVQLQLKHTLHGHFDAVTCIAASSAYNIIVSGSKDQTCIIWDINRMVFVRQLRDHSGSVSLVTINHSNGNIVSCTKTQIFLWTVNGTLLASTTVLTAGNFRFLCCAVSEMFDWDKDNVIVTGSSDGIVRMWVLDYVREDKDQLSKSPVSQTESNLDDPVKARPAGVVQKLRDVLETEGASEEEVDAHELSSDEEVKPGEATDSSSEEEIYATPAADTPAASTPATDTPSAPFDDNPVYRLGSETDESSIPVDSEPSNLDLLQSCGSERERASSLQEEYKADDEVDGLDRPSIRRVKSQPTKTAMVREEAGDRLQDGTADNDRQAELKKAKSTDASSMKPTLEQYIAEARKKAEELKEKTGKWSRKLTQVHQLTMHTAVSRKDNDTPAAVTSLCISRDHRKLFIGDSRGRVFSWTVSESLGGVMEHWLRDEAVDKCMKCSVEFTFTERKHHCRDCGKIFCAKCSSFESEVERLRIMKKVRVCEDCHKRLKSLRSARS